MQKKIAFLDRDGVINKKGEPGTYITSVEKFAFSDGAVKFLKHLVAEGFEIIVVTNQRGVARGYMTEADLHAIHQYMETELSKHSVEILDIFYCPHEKNSCDCRKPEPGMLNKAVTKYPIDLKASILVSDFQKDVEMGIKFGIGRNVLIPADHPEHYYGQ